MGVDGVLCSMELALRENDIVDILADDFSMLSRQDDGIIGGSKTENSLRVRRQSMLVWFSFLFL